LADYYEENKDMKLSYRGVSYNNEPFSLEMTEGEIGGKYRGQDWKYHYPRHIPQLQPKLYQQYRGIVYSTSAVSLAEYPATAQSESQNHTCPVPLRKPCKVVTNELTKTHLENMRRNLERRLEVAKAKGDEKLVNLLQQESQDLALKM
jgi:hypothetical protein